MGILGQIHVGPRVPYVALPQLRVAGMRENLVHTAARHHIAARKQGHHAIAHLPLSQARCPATTPGLTARQSGRPVSRQSTGPVGTTSRTAVLRNPGLMNTNEPLTQIRSSCAPVLPDHADPRPRSAPVQRTMPMSGRVALKKLSGPTDDWQHEPVGTSW